MDLTGQRRGSRFSFSRAPEQSAASNMAKLKTQFRVQIQNVITPKKNQEDLDPAVMAHQIAEKLGISLDEEDLLIIKFCFKEYQQNYEEQEVLGEGCIGLVRAIKRRSDGKLFAVKIVKTSDEEIVKNMIIEFKNLQKLIHPNIVRMFEIYINYNDGFQSASTVCIVMEKIGGMEMFEVIQTMGQYSELQARSIFAQILEAIKFMHNNYCCHRDLKPNNILCSYDGKQVKITDFNVSKFSDQYKEFSNIINEQGKIEMWTYTGTVAFSAPEVFSGGFYNEQVDMWSAGCILFTMLSGQLPFNADYLDDLIKKITKGEYDFTNEIWSNISDEAKNLISALLQVDSTHRMKPDEALQHSWIVGEKAPNITLRRDILSLNIDKLVFNKHHEITPQQQVRRMRARCILFGAQEVWKRHSMGQSSVSLFDDFRKVKSFDIRPIEEGGVKVTKDDEKKNVYKISVPAFSDDDDS